MTTSHDIAKLLLRLAVGGLMLFHGIAKLNAKALAAMAGMVTSHGLPEFVKYGVYAGEVLAPIAVVIGLFARPAAAIMAINMIVAVWLAHRGDLLHLGKNGGYALELPALYFVGAVAIVFMGAGRFAVRRE